MNFKIHFAAIIRRNIKDPNFAAERILKLVEKNFTCNKQQKDEICPDCGGTGKYNNGNSLPTGICLRCHYTGKLSAV